MKRKWNEKWNIKKKSEYWYVKAERNSKGHFITWKLIKKRSYGLLNLFRGSFALNFPIHKKYYGAIAQVWISISDYNSSKKDKITDWIKEKLSKFTIEYLGYSRKEMWFDIEAIEGEGWQKVKEKKEFLNKYEIRMENEKGITIKKEDGKIEA